jgi:tetratricopeptide (TPR) repeat protein
MDMHELDKLMKRFDFSWLEKLQEQIPDGAELPDIAAIQMQWSAIAAEKEGRWETAASLWEQFVTRIERDSVLSMLFTSSLGAKSRLANAYRMLNRAKQALEIYTQIVELTENPDFIEGIKNDTEMMSKAARLFLEPLMTSSPGMSADMLVFDALYKMVDIGLDMPEFSLVLLYDVLDKGIRFIETMDHPEWGHALRSRRAVLLMEQNRKQEALDEAIAALSLREQDTFGPGYGIATHLCQVGDYLNDVGRHDEAIRYFERVLHDPATSRGMRRRAYAGLGDAYLDLGHLELAKDMAYRELSIVQQMESPVALRASYSFLSLVLSRQGRIREATHAATQMWIASRRVREATIEYRTYLRCAEVRLRQARSVLQLEVQGEPPEKLSEGISSHDLKIAQHYLLSARRWLERARRPAMQLDSRTDVRLRQESIDRLWEEVSCLLDLI